MKDHHISDEYDGQGHRSRVKVTMVNPVFSPISKTWSEVKVTRVKVNKVKVKSRRSRSENGKGQGTRHSLLENAVLLRVFYIFSSIG